MIDFASMSIEELEENYKRYESLLFLNEMTHGLRVNCEWRLNAILRTGRLSSERITKLDKEIEAEWLEFLQKVSSIKRNPLDKAAE